MRAPSIAELILDFAEFVAEPLGEERRYGDADLAVARDSNEIDAAALHRVSRALSTLKAATDSDLRSWFGRFITCYRSVHGAVAAARMISPAQLLAKLRRADVVRNPWSRMAWMRDGRKTRLFAGGDEFACKRAFASLLTAHRRIRGPDIVRIATLTDLAALTQLVNAGHCVLKRRS